MFGGMLKEHGSHVCGYVVTCSGVSKVMVGLSGQRMLGRRFNCSNIGLQNSEIGDDTWRMLWPRVFGGHQQTGGTMPCSVEWKPTTFETCYMPK